MPDARVTANAGGIEIAREPLIAEWEPPMGLDRLVEIVRTVSPDDAADLLRIAFKHAGAFSLAQFLHDFQETVR